MDDSTSQLIKNSIAAGVRWLLVLAGGFLVKKGMITPEQSDAYISQVTPVLIGLGMAGIALLWSLWQKRRANEKVDLALSLPSNTTRAQLEKKQDANPTRDQ